MKCKKIYLPQEITSDEWGYGLGSVYLAGPRNADKISWRVDLIRKLEESGTPMSILIPESKFQIKGMNSRIPRDERFKWQNFAMSMASAIIFWYPSGAFDPQGYVEFGSWYKSERAFFGRECCQQNDYLDWLFHKERLCKPADNLDQLVERVTGWIRG